jgi:tetratricopeptide (TPR) repeat protein
MLQKNSIPYLSDMKKHLFLPILIAITIFSCSEKSKDKNTITDKSDLQKLTIEEITQLIREDPKNAVLYDVRSDLYLKKGVIDSAIHSLEMAVAIDSFESAYILKLSDLYLRNKGQSEKTKSLLEKCIRLFPKNFQAHLNLASLNFYVRQYNEALTWLDKAKELDKYNPHQYFTRALVLLEMGDTAKAISNFQTTVELEASYFDAHIELGRIFSYLGDSVALQYYRNALDLVPESIDAHYNMAMFYQDAGNFNKALETYNKILEIDANFYPAYHNIGYMYLYKEEFNEGVEFFTKAIEINPQYLQAYLHRGVCYEEMRNFTAAEADFRKCLEISTNFQLALDGLNRIDKKK